MTVSPQRKSDADIAFEPDATPVLKPLQTAPSRASEGKRANYRDHDFMGAWREIKRGLLSYRIYWALANSEIRGRYRRSFFGPFWATLASSVTILGLGLLWSQLWKVSLAEYFPYLAAGIITWNYIAAVLIEAPNVFISQQGLLKSTNISLFIYPMRSAVRQLVLALHQAPVMIVVLLIFGREIKPVALLSIVGLFLIFINSIWIMAVIGMAGARMRDLSFTIEAAVPLAFFLTPVLWRTEDLKANHPFVSYNPFANALDLVRAPILGGAPQTESYVIMISAAVLGWGLMLWAFRYRHRIAFWVQ